jgi:hypothetical protein
MTTVSGLTRIRLPFVAYFGSHREQFAGKDGSTSTRFRGKTAAKEFGKNYMSCQFLELRQKFHPVCNVHITAAISFRAFRIAAKVKNYMSSEIWIKFVVAALTY